MTTKTTKVVKPVTKVADKKKPAPAAAKFKKTA
jgi:hypothetical protein